LPNSVIIISPDHSHSNPNPNILPSLRYTPIYTAVTLETLFYNTALVVSQVKSSQVNAIDGRRLF